MSAPAPSSDPKAEKARSTPLGLYAQPNTSRISGIEVIALALSLLWLAGAVIFFVFLPEAGGNLDALRFIITLLAIFLPVAMIWVAATAARASRVMREESLRLQTAIDAIRQAQIAQAQRGAVSAEGAVQKKLDEIAETAKKTETALATFHTIRMSSPRPAMPAPAPVQADSGDQGALELGTPAEALSPPLATQDFIRALHFPETAEDEEGFAALRRALKDRKVAQLIQAAQDVLTLLSQDGIYMDDLRPDRARPEIWRQFAQGTRGREVAVLGGVRDRSSLALTAARMKQDPIFRDAAHHFLRRFDQMFAAFAEEASDEEITALADTRTARAFMLLGRVAGTFD
ncbi:hypothetical protein [Pseudodonghicola flavimaris]|uniref:Uncharacterized protein n=1 Tax=Pseudodonghicola flavimaris TaxID=3050036 RepID=A0ABT7EXA4_9RHOB|nr:hypothetical protein [Pseudodonghicola flavimaris]MDK3016977.1 hypothetical protein [Pseudodonghicola flavimaris]